MGTASYFHKGSQLISSGHSSALESGTSSTHLAEKFKARANYKLWGIPKYLFWILLAIIVLAIVVPLAVMFGKKDKDPPPSDILIPLYVYPSPGAWDPVYTAATTYPELNFIVVINPANGPGPGNGPDGNYTREIPRLNSHPNIRTVGYVSTSWAKRDVSLVMQDINRYSAWEANTTVEGGELGMHGIFLDETPSQYDNASAEFLQTIESAVVSAAGLGDNPLVIHNPGTVPDPRYLSSSNLTIVFEGSYATYQSHGMHKIISALSASSNIKREALACIVYDITSNTVDATGNTTLPSKEEKILIHDLRSVAGSIFVTGLDTDYYSTFWGGWMGFVSEMVG